MMGVHILAEPAMDLDSLRVPLPPVPDNKDDRHGGEHDQEQEGEYQGDHDGFVYTFYKIVN